MASTAKPDTEPEKTYQCSTCEDSKKVHLALTGASGGITKEVPCPDCSGGITLENGNAVNGEELVQRMQQLAWLVGIALGIAAMALFLSRMGGEHGNPWHQVLKGEAENVT